MAKYTNKQGDDREYDLIQYKWSIIPETEWDNKYISYDECLDNNMVAIRLDSEQLGDVFEDANPTYPDGGDFVELHYMYMTDDILCFNPIAVSITYPLNDEYDYGYRNLQLDISEKEYFSKLLYDTIGDKHSSEMQKVMVSYYKAVDVEIYNFVNDVLNGREVLPITVGYLSESQRETIIKCIGNKIDFAARCILDADAIRHILKRHGANGLADCSMKDISDIARMAYIIANFDEASFDGTHSKRYHCSDGSPAPHIVLKKRIDGVYYVVNVVTDAKAKKSHIISAFIG